MTEVNSGDGMRGESSPDDPELKALEEQLLAEETKLNAMRHNVSKLRERRKRHYSVQPPPLVHAGGATHTTYAAASGNSDGLPPPPPLKATTVNHVAQQPRLVQSHGMSHQVHLSAGSTVHVDESQASHGDSYVRMSHPVVYQDGKQLPGSVGEEHVRIAKRRLRTSQDAARQMFGHQVERSLANVPVPRPPPDQWPICPWAMGSHFSSLVGLESVVSFIQSGKLPDQENTGHARSHMRCSSCHADFSPVWRLVRDSQRPCIVCEKCENARIKQALGSHYTRRLRGAFAQTEQQEREFEAKMEQQVMDEAQRVRHEQYIYSHNDQMARQHHQHQQQQQQQLVRSSQQQTRDQNAEMLRRMIQQQKETETRQTLTGTTSHITV